MGIRKLLRPLLIGVGMSAAFSVSAAVTFYSDAAGTLALALDGLRLSDWTTESMLATAGLGDTAGSVSLALLGVACMAIVVKRRK